MKLRGRAALVTGGGRGIGRAIALAFGREGAAVAVAARTESQVAAVHRELGEIGAEALGFSMDVTDPGDCRGAVHTCVDRFGRLDILVNNAGVIEGSKFLDIEDDAWERILRTDLTGAFYMTRAALPALLQSDAGAVISISSIAAKLGLPYHAPYAVAKAGVNALMRSLAVEYARRGVTFNAVCPAYTETAMVDREVEAIVGRTGRSRDEVIGAMRSPVGRLIMPEEVAALCVLLAGPEGRAINGQAINVDGGWTHA